MILSGEVLSSVDGVQTLRCTACGKTWERTAQQGRPPKFCDNCRRKAPALKGDTPVPFFRAKPAPKADKTHHNAFSTLLSVAKSKRRVPAMLVGPAGSGKTTAARQVAEALSLPFWAESCNPGMSKWDIYGFSTVDGGYKPGIVRDAFENGGVLLLDEMDASNSSVLVAINMIAACSIGEEVTFPDGVNVPRHADFILIAGCNTFGDGASDVYVGREQLDAATLDRFACIRWDYDSDLEFMAAGPDARDWVTFVQQVRKAAAACKVDLLVTPRASINGADLLREGMPRNVVEDLTVWKGLDPDALRSIKAEMKRQGF